MKNQSYNFQNVQCCLLVLKILEKQLRFIVGNKSDKDEERNNLSKTNYLAITALEKISLIEPTQAQIDVIENVILLANQVEYLTPEDLKLFTGNDFKSN